MASNLGDLVATATLDISPFQLNARNLAIHLRTLDKSLNSLETKFGNHGRKLDGMRQRYSLLGKSIASHQALLAQQTAKYKQVEKEVGEFSKANAEGKTKLLGVQSAISETTFKLAELQERYKALSREMNVFYRTGQSMQNFGGKITNLGNNLAGVGRAFTTGVTLPIVGGVAAISKAAINYESAFAGVKKTVDETATTSYNDLSRAIRNLSKELPASAAEIAGVAEIAGQLGISADNIIDFTKVMIDMGESTNLSANDAATSIAKIANITGLTADQYQRFGSAVVDLGNNFATTESDILQMANRMAASGTIAGLTNQEILALATAMSSVGIEAEAGGSAMNRTLAQIEKAVVEGGEKLQGFAEIAGMSAEEFSNKWKSSPIEAIQAFTKGLGELEKQGESSTLKLDDLGISSIRQLNMLKSLALASDVMSDAVKTSNKAWNDNSALTVEANKRYETTESKLKMLRNEVTDMAIELGGPLLDAMRDAVDAGRPIIEMAARMAKQFSSLDKEQQQQIIKWGLMAAAAGPALSILGKGIGIVGSVVTGLGKASSAVGSLYSWIRTLGTASSGIQAVSTAAGTATTSMTGLAGSVGLLSHPAAWGVLLAGTAAVAIAYFATEANKARQRASEWGTEVSELEAVELSNFKAKVDDTNKAMSDFGSGGVRNVDGVKEAFKELVTEIEKLNNKKLKKTISDAESVGLSKETINTLKKNSSETIQSVQQMSDEVIKIYQNANDQKRKLTEEEKAIVLKNQNELINTQLSLMDYSKKERIAITKAMNGQIDELNEAQLTKSLQVARKWLDEEDKLYKKRKTALENSLEQIKGTDAESLKAKKEINAKLRDLEADHQAKMEAYGEKYVKISQKLANMHFDANSKLNPQDRETFFKTYSKTMTTEMEKLGLSYDELVKKATTATSKVQEAHSLWALTTKDSTKEATLANTQWNAMVWDFKTGKVKTNAQEEIQKALKAENGWNSMKLVVQNANLKSNARLEIATALKATGQWESLNIKDKELVVGKEKAIQSIVESKELLGIWNALPAEVKELLANNSDFMTNSATAKSALENWNALPPAKKELLAENLTSGDVNAAQATINTLTGKKVDLKASNATGPDVASAKTSIATVPRETMTYLNATDNISGVIGSISGSLGVLANKAFSLSIGRNEKGTNNHPGGLAMVNDQRGSLYKELVTLPTGESFIPEGRNVILPLPKGSKVLKASKTQQLMSRLGIPKYADGIGFENTGVANLARRMRDVTAVNVSNGSTSNSLISLVETIVSILMQKMTDRKDTENIIYLLSKILTKDTTVQIAGKTIATATYKESARLSQRDATLKKIMEGDFSW